MKTTITKVAVIVMTFLLASVTTYADIVLTAPTLQICPGTSTASLSFTVTGAQNLGSISMKVSIDHSVLFNTPFTVTSHAALTAGGFVMSNVTNTNLAYAWFSTGAATIPDGATMCTFTVPYLGGSCPLTFINIGVDCVFSDINGNDIPTTWVTGSVGPVPTLAINTQPQNLTVLQGVDANFTVTPNVATTYAWQESTDGGGTWTDLVEGAPYIGVSTSSLTIAAVTPTFNGYQYRCNITAPCSQSITSDAATLTVSTEVPLPLAFDMSGGGTICEGAPGISFLLSGSELDVSYELYLEGVGTGYIIAGTGGPLSFDNITAGGNYTIVGTNAYGSTTMNGTGLLVVNPLPIVSLGDFTPVCIDAPGFLLTGGSPEGGTYSGIGVGDNTFYPNISGEGTFTITYTYTDGNGCTAQATANLTVNPLPVVSWTEVLPTLCSNSAPFELTGGLPAGGVYSGTGVTGGFFVPADAGSGDFVLTYTYTDVNNCTGSVTNNITVAPAEAISPMPLPVSVTEGGNASFIVGFPRAATYLWQISTDGGVIFTDLVEDATYVGVTAPQLDVMGVTLGMNNNMFRCIVTDGICNLALTSTSATLTVTSCVLPLVYDVTGGGEFCVGNPGVSIGLSGSESNATYELYVDNVTTGIILTGTDLTLDFGLQTIGGTYTVKATNSCGTVDMNGSVIVTANPVPTVYNVGGGGLFCEGTNGAVITLSGSDAGAMYFVYNGATFMESKAGDGLEMTFGPYNTPGEYTITGEYNIACIANMAGSAILTLDPNPTAFDVTGGGSICTGGFSSVTLSNSEIGVEASGILYNLYLNDVATGMSLVGNGSPLTFENLTEAGVYNVIAVTNCGNFPMNGSAVVTFSNGPTAFTVTGGGNVCPGDAGVSVGLSSSEENASYELFLNDVTTGITLTGNGQPLDFGVQSLAGTYTVIGTNSCGVVPMTGSVNVFVVMAVEITGQPDNVSVITGGNASFSISTANPASAQWQVSTDEGLTYTDLTNTAPYSGVTTYILDITGTTADMNGYLFRCSLWDPLCEVSTLTYSTPGQLTVNQPSAIIVTAPAIDNATIGGTVVVPVTVENASGVAAISLSLGFDPAVLTYTGYQNENTALSGGMLVVNLLGSNVKFGWFDVNPISITSGTLIEYLFTFNGGYSDLTWDLTPGECQFTDIVPSPLAAEFINGHVTGTCELPVAFEVSGGGSFCPGAEGSLIELSGSEANATYELFRDGASVVIVPGTGEAISFGLQSIPGLYTVVGTNVCGSTEMTGSATITQLSLPALYTVTGDATGCSNVQFVIALDGSEIGATYQIFKDGIATLNDLVAGTGAPISFIVSEAGVYTITATNTCGTVEMNGSATINIYAVPTVFDVTGGGTFCSGGTGLNVGLSGSETGVSYALYLNGETTGNVLEGTGSMLDFGTLTTEGNYTVIATYPCGNIDMTGSATITIQAAITFTLDPTDVTTAVGGNASFNVTTNIPGTYLWQVSVDGGLTYSDLTDDATYSGVTTNQLTVSNVTSLMNGYLYRCSAYDPFCGVTTMIYSAAGMLNVTSLPAIITTAPSIDNAIPGNTVIVPITVENINQVATISLSLGFDPTVLTYQGYQNVNSALDAAFFSVNLLGNNVKLAWFSLTPITIASGTLIEYVFTFNEGYSPLTWDLTPGENQYSDIVPTVLDAIFVDGHVTGTCPLPVAFNVTGGGSYCPAEGGVAVGLDGSENATTYELFVNSVTTGIVLNGDGNALNFGLLSANGTYTILATNACGNTEMTGNAVVNSLSLPAAFDVTGGGTLCPGGDPLTVTLSGSEVGVNYELYVDGAASGNIMAGTGLALDFASLTAGGIYTINATNTCGTVLMNGSATIDVQAAIVFTSQPVNASIFVGGNASFTVTSNFPCSAQWQVSVDGGLTFIDLTNTAPYSNVTTYQLDITGATADLSGYLYRCNLTNPLCGISSLTSSDAALLTVTPLPLIITTAPSIDDAIPGNTVVVPITVENINGVAAISLSLGFDPAVLTYTGYQNVNDVLSSGIMSINLSGSNIKLGWVSVTPITLASGILVEYLFTFNGGYSPLTWDAAVGQNEYQDITPTVLGATFIDGHVTGICDLPMAFNVTGGGAYCPPALGVNIGIDGSETNATYEIFLDGVTTGQTFTGTGAALDFGVFATAGTYTVSATNICGTTSMEGNAVVTINPATLAFNMTGGGSFCTGATGFEIGLDGSQPDVNYELFLDGTSTGIIIAGDGNALSFGTQTTAGTYTTVGTGICGAVPMNGNAVITTGATITVYNVVGGGTFEAGGAGIEVSLSGSETGVNYQLLLNGSAVGSPVAGTGSPISFGFQTVAGTYTILGIDAATNCQLMMNGGATVIVIPVIIGQPADMTVYAGFGAWFNVNALGATIYQWQISTDGGATFTDLTESNPFFNVDAATLNIYGAPLSFSGYKFRCQVSTPGSPIVTSNAATLIVIVTPALTTIAPTMTVPPNTLIAVPITVQGFDNIAAFNITLNYDASVMAPAGTQNEDPGLLAGNGLQVMNSLPGQFLMAWYSLTPVSIAYNGTMIELLFNFIDGSTPLIWQLAPESGAQYGNMFGQVIPSIWINGFINSTNSLIITQQPENATACEGGSVTYSVATSPAATTYQWVVTTDYGMTWLPLIESPMFVGVNTNNLVVNGVSASMSNFMFACRIDQGLPTAVVSNVASLNIITYDIIHATIVASPGNIICPGTPVTFSVSSTVDLTGASYIWYINSIPASSSASFTTASLVNGDIVKVDVMLSTTCVVAEVPTMTMVVDPQPVVTTDPVNAIVVVGDDPTFSVTASSVSGPVAYQWQISTDNGGSFTDLIEGAPYSGVNTAVLQITDATLLMNYYQFRCVVTEPLCGNTVTSGAAILYVFPAHVITYAPDVVVCNGEQIIVPITVDNFTDLASMSLKLNFDPSIITYTGYQNFNPDLTVGSYGVNDNGGNQVALFWFSVTPVSLVNGSLITELVFTPASTGTTALTWDPVYGSCMYSDVNAIIVPSIFIDGSVTVNPLPVVYNVTGGGEYCIGGVGVEVGLSGSETGVNYELFLDGISTGNIVAGTGSAISFGNQLLAGTYTVVATNATTLCVSNMAGSATVIINPLPVVTWSNALATQCEFADMYLLIGGTPVGGTYSGPGVVGNYFDPSIAGPGTHTLTYTYQDENGCINSVTNTITVLDGPNPFDVTGGGAYCHGGDGVLVGLASSEPAIIYQLFINGVNSGSPVFGTGSNINFGYQTVPGVYTVWGLNIFNGCATLMNGSVTVTEFTPNVTWTTPLGALCQNSSPIQLTGGLPAGGTYSGNGVVNGYFDPVIAGNGVHVLTYTYIDYSVVPTGCIGSATNTIIVNPGPDVTFSPLPDICLTASAFNLNTYVTPVGGTFSGAGVSGTMFDPFVAGAGAHVIQYSYVASTCTVIITRSITVLPLPVVTWSNTLESQCINATGYFLTGGTPAGGVYSGTGVTGNVFNASLAGVGTHTLTYTYTDGNGCINSIINTITVNNLPDVTWSNILENKCVNLTTYALTGGSPAGGTYSGPGVSGSNFNANLAGIGIHTLTYTYTDPITGCTNEATNTITVTPVPTVTFNTLPDVCYNAQPLELSPFVTPTGGTFSGLGVSGNTFNPLVAGVGLHSITYSYTLNGCTVEVSRDINVVPAPTVTWTTPLTAQCENATSYFLTGGTPVGGFYSGPGVIGNLFNASLVGPGTYTLTYTYTDPNSGCTGTATNSITVNTLPTVTWTTAPITVCVDGAVINLVALPAGGTYSGPGVSGSTFNPTVAGAGTFVITYTYTDASGCTNSADLSVTVNPLPTVTFAGTFPLICSSSTEFLLTNGWPQGGTYSGPGVTGNNFNASVAGEGTHTLTYTYTDPQTGCTNFATNTIIVTGAPAVTWTGAIPSICLNDNVLLTGGLPLGGSYSGQGVNLNVFSATSVGTFTFTYTYTDPVTGCQGSATNTITVNPLPTVTFTGVLASQCVSATSYLLTGGSPLGGTYSGPGVTGNNFNASVAGIGTHVITYTYTDPTTGCTNSATNTITVDNPPAVTFTWTGPTDFCINGASVTLSGGLPAGGVYSGAGVTGTTFDPATAGLGSHVITYTYTNSSGCIGTATIIFEVHPLPNVTFGGTLVAQCVTSTTYLLTGGLPGGGTYSGSGVSGNNFNASIGGIGLHTITYTYTDGFGCTNSATNTIEVIAAPVVTWNNALQAQCEYEVTYILSGGSPIGGVYSGPGVNGTNFNAALAGVGTHILTYTYTDPITHCSNSATNTIVVNAKPIVTWNTTLEPQCVSATSYPLTGGQPAGGTYSGPGVNGNVFNASTLTPGMSYTLTYTYQDPVTGCINTANNVIQVVNNPNVFFPGILPAQCVNSTNLVLNLGVPAGGTYSGPGVTGNNFNASVAGVGTWVITYTYSNAQGCIGSATNTVTVHPLPVVGWTNTLTTQCAGNTSYVLTGGSPLGGTYSGPGVTGNIFNASVAGVGTFTLTYTFVDANGCSNSATNTIVVVEMPTVDIGPDQNICFGLTTTLTATATPVGGVTYLWNTGATTQTINVIAGDTTTYYVTVTTSFGCTAVDSVVVMPLPLPTAGATANPITICAGESTIISGSGGSGTTPYLWNNGNTSQSWVTGPLTDTTYYTVTVMNTYGCIDVATVRVNVNMIPIVSLGPDIIACENYTVTLSPTGSTPFDNFLWNNGAETPTLAVDSTGFGLNNPATWTVTVTLNGCQAKDAVVVTFVPCPGIPEIGKVEKIEVYPNPTDGRFTVTIENYDKPLTFDIYNNIGQRLFSEKLQNNSNAKFTKDFDLSRYPVGFYILRFTDGDKVKSKKLIVK